MSNLNKFKCIINFIREIYKKPNGFIPLHAPYFSGNEKKYLLECIDSTYVSSVGSHVELFEKKIAHYTNSRAAVACINGTNALHLSLLLADVRPGNEIITQPLTFIATANAIRYCGAEPIFIDIDLETLGMNPDSLRDFLINNTYNLKNGCFNKLTGKKIAACIPVHTFGLPCKIEDIETICKEYSIDLIEDAAESFGSFYNNKHTGTFGKIGVLSFNGNKIITTGGGGMMLFNDIELAKKAKHLTKQAKIPHKWEFVHDEIGYNYRLPNINAALGIAQLEQIDIFLEKKRKLASSYKSFLTKMGIKYVSEAKLAKSNYWLNTIILNNKLERDHFLEYSNSQNVMTRPAWRLLHTLKMYKNCQCDNLKNAKWLEKRIVNLPSSVI